MRASDICIPLGYTLMCGAASPTGSSAKPRESGTRSRDCAGCFCLAGYTDLFYTE